MKLRSIPIAIVALFVAAIATARPHPPLKALAEYLQLSDEQITAWREIQKGTAEAVQPLVANAKDLRTRLDAALNAASADPAAVGKLAISLHAVKAQIRDAHEAAKARRVALLNAEQKTKFEAFEAAAAFLRHRRGGPGAGKGAGPMPPR